MPPSATSSTFATTESEQKFRFLKQFNAPPFSKKIACKDRLRESDTRWFPGDYLSSVFARALCKNRAVPFKEVLESFEFYECVRKQLRSASVTDLCCGHGLVGILFAMFERKVDRVSLLDKVQPDSFQIVLRTAIEIAPWVRDKIEYVVSPLEEAHNHLSASTDIVGVHACGDRTDKCIDLAIALRGSVAVLPCCRHHRSHPSPPCLKAMLGGDVAIDVDRTYRLYHAGYHVRWDQIPVGITEMNRVLIGIWKSEAQPAIEAEADSHLSD